MSRKSWSEVGVGATRRGHRKSSTWSIILPNCPTFSLNLVCSGRCYCNVVLVLSCSAVSHSLPTSGLSSSLHGISQARILEWVAVSFSRGSSWPRDWTHNLCLLCWQADYLPLYPISILLFFTVTEPEFLLGPQSTQLNTTTSTGFLNVRGDQVTQYWPIAWKLRLLDNTIWKFFFSW